MQISISDLKKYINCPRSYWLSEIQGAEPETKSLTYCRSIAVKQTISLIHGDQSKKSYDYSKEEINALCQRVWDAVIDDEKVSEEELNVVVIKAKKATKNKLEEPAITKGQRILSNIQNWIFEYSREEIDAEVIGSNIYFQDVIGDTTFVGHIDMIRRVNGQIQVIIFNSSSCVPNNTYLNQDFVLSLYSHAVWQGTLFPNYPNIEEKVELKILPDVCVYYLPHLERYQKKTGKHKKGDRKGNPLINVTRTDQELFNFEYELMYTVSGMQNDFFPKMPSNPCGCSLCPYKKVCKEQPIFQSQVDTSFDIEEFEQEEMKV